MGKESMPMRFEPITEFNSLIFFSWLMSMTEKFLGSYQAFGVIGPNLAFFGGGP